MKFYDWASNAEGNSLVQDFQVRGWEDDFELMWRLQEGKLLDPWDPEATVYWEEDGPLTDVPFTNPDIMLISPRLRALLEDLGLGEEIQFLPVQLIGRKSGQPVGTYFIANFLRRIPCLDREHSVYDVYGPDWIRPEQHGQVAGIWKAVLRREAIGDARVFRLDEFDPIVVVREDVKAAMEEEGITGCWFQELEVV